MCVYPFELAQLKKSGFGRSLPRHGLKLLHCIAVRLRNNDMYMFCNPKYDNYGFHQFFNEPKREWHVLLPVENGLTYYTVGNLKIEAKNPSRMTSQANFLVNTVPATWIVSFLELIRVTMFALSMPVNITAVMLPQKSAGDCSFILVI